MHSKLTTREEAAALGKDMCDALPGLAEGFGASKSWKKEYTRAVWRYFDDLRKTKTPHWILWPKHPPTGGKVKGEYLTDFSLCDDELGYRIACESEWGGYKSIEWAFDKLRAVKADTKILIFQDRHNVNGRLPDRIQRLFTTNFAKCAHHHPGHETYLFIQFQGNKPRLFVWTPSECGPCDVNDIRIEAVN